MNDFKGVRTSELKILQAVLIFIRTIRPYDTMEIKLDKENFKRIVAHVHNQHRESFDMD